MFMTETDSAQLALPARVTGHSVVDATVTSLKLRENIKPLDGEGILVRCI